MNLHSPICPNCGGGELQLLSSREGSEFFDLDSGELVGQTIYVFQCDCGRRFAHAVRKTSDFRQNPKNEPHHV